MADDRALACILPGEALPDGGAAAVGGKAWNLCRLVAAGLPVPAAFVLPTAWCRAPRDPGALRLALATGIARLEAATGLGFGSPRRPLLVSVRSGAAVSMPGMLETVLNIGLNARCVEGLMRLTGNPRLAWDSYRWLVQGYAEVVGGLPAAPFEALLQDAIATDRVESEHALDHRSLHRLTEAMQARYTALAGAAFPGTPMEQLVASVEAVFRSWDAPKAVSYRHLNALDGLAGTAVTVQAMVFGNAGGTSGAGVGFTRNPATGAPGLYFDFCRNGQGEDVVAGRRTLADNDRLCRAMPVLLQELQAAAGRLEALFHDAQDFEFTVQEGRLYLLQCRRAQRTPLAALRMAVDMVEEGLIAPDEALRRLQRVDLEALGRTTFAPPLPPPLAQAVVAGVGVARGPLALDEAAAERFAAAGTPAVLVRPETLTDDIAGLALACGLLTAAGSRTAHAAVVARQLGKPCLVGCPQLHIDLDRRVCRIGATLFAEGDAISLDGNTGAIYPGLLTVVTERPDHELAAVAGWRAATSQAASACGMTHPEVCHGRAGGKEGTRLA